VPRLVPRSAPMSATGILWLTSRKPTKHSEARLAEMDGRRPFIRPGLHGNVVPQPDSFSAATVHLFDYLVGFDKHVVRHCETERSCRL
jgi:hypothetical protein